MLAPGFSPARSQLAPSLLTVLFGFPM